MATATQPRQTTRTIEKEVDIEAVIRQTEIDIAALRAKIDEAVPGLQRAVATSRALQRVRQLVNVAFINEIVFPLMNSPVGFLTDKKGDKGQADFYTAEQLIEPITECLIRGFRIDGNEMNVIAGRFYGAQEGYRRLVSEIPGVTDIEEIPGTPVADAGNTTVRFLIRCKVNGKTWELKNEKGEPGRKFTIRVNSGSTVDAIIGKATRKALKAAYKELTGKMTEPDEAEGAQNAPAEIPTGRSKIPNGNGKTTPPAELPTEKLDVAGGEVPNETPADFDAEAAGQWAMNLNDAIHEAVSMDGMYKVGADIKERRKLLGEKNYGELMGAYQAKSAELLAATARKGI